jgi:4-hydroxy-tetrahydrodipicolinate synthase
MILYNVPGRTGVNMTAETTLKLAREVKQVVAVKEASGNLSQIMEIIRHRPETLAVLSGDDALALPVIALGGEGVISVAANAFPEEVSTMVRNMLGGHYEDARTIHYALLEFINALFVEGNPCGIKAAAHILGIAGNLVRLPLVPVSEGTYQKMESLIKELKPH